MKRLVLVALLVAAPLLAQDTTAGRGRGGRGGAGRGGGGRPVVITDTARARALFVSKDPKDLPGCGPNNCEANTQARLKDDSTFAARSKAAGIEYKKVTFKSRVDGLELYGSLFAPMNKGAEKHAAMVWVHGGVHSHMTPNPYWPFIKEAVQRGYVIITPEYRGSTGYGQDFYAKIDYGGKEVDDAISSVDYLKTLSFVDMDRLGIMGWSHGGFITAHTLFRENHPFRAGAAIVPVTNLIFRLSDHGPSYQRDYAAEEGIQGLPFENTCGPKQDHTCWEEYINRSPVFHVENLKVPMLSHVATNDCDVYFREDQQMIYTLRAMKPELVETKIYINPPVGRAGCGHEFSRRTNPETLEREDSPEQIDSWNRTWTFFEWNLRPLSVIRKDNKEWQKDPRIFDPRNTRPPL